LSYYEAANGPCGILLNPNATDTDGDGLADTEYSVIGTDPTNPDTDRDGLNDREELNLASDGFATDAWMAEMDWTASGIPSE